MLRETLSLRFWTRYDTNQNSLFLQISKKGRVSHDAAHFLIFMFPEEKIMCVLLDVFRQCSIKIYVVGTQSLGGV